MRIKIKKPLQAVTVLVFAAIFIALGIWQLQRAQELQEAKNVVVDTTIYPLAQLASATGSIPAENILKVAQTTGRFIATYKAPNQKDGAGALADWEVGLLEEDSGGGAILVVRGLWAERATDSADAFTEQVTVTGKLLPKQNEDRALNRDGQVSRIDSALLVSTYAGQLYDGFILATSEERNGEKDDRTRISPPELTPGVPGYYWQHISYVVVWWFLAALVVWAPFYRRRD
jgi:cytochrome oxidase assembly protein ShyY1